MTVSTTRKQDLTNSPFIYPAIAVDQIHIYNPSNEQYQASLVDMSGYLIDSKALDPLSTLDWAVGHLPQGVYMVQLVSESHPTEMVSRRFVKN